MKRELKLLPLLALLAAAPLGSSAATANIFINEWMAGNINTLLDPADGQFEDWFELYNANSMPVDLSGYFLTDTPTVKTLFQIPANGQYIIPAHGFLLVWADSEPGQNIPSRGDLHVNFSLGAKGGSIALFGPDGITLVDSVTYTNQIGDLTEGRFPDGTASRFFLPSATPRAANVACSTNDPVWVKNLNDTGPSSLRAAVACAPAGAKILFDQGLNGTINLGSGELTLERNMSIEGPGRSLITLDGQGLSRIFRVSSGTVQISGLTLYHGNAHGLDGTDAASAFEIGQPGEAALGGAILNFGDLVVSDCLLTNCTASGGKGGEGSPDIAGATATGGGIGGEARGGAIYNGNRLVLANSTLFFGVALAGKGGGGGSSEYAAHAVAGAGGNGGDAFGGGVFNSGTLMASNCLFHQCWAEGNDGGAGGDATMFQGRGGGSGGNGGLGNGGGIYNSGTSLVVNCTFFSNYGLGGFGGNGGDGRTGDGRGGNGGNALGGALFNRTGFEAVLVHDTIVSGGVLPGDEGVSPQFDNNGNRGNSIGGGVYDESLSDTRFLNTLVAYNNATSSHPDVFGIVTSLGHNFIRARDSSLGWVASDQTGNIGTPLDPMVNPLSDNGGASLSIMPRRGSPLVDGGDRVTLDTWSIRTDQRGAYRQAGTGVDIGAVEAPYGSFRVVVNTKDSGLGTLREALNEIALDASHSGYGQVSFAPWVSGIVELTSGELILPGWTSIFGPGADKLAVSGGHRSRVFRILAGAGQSSLLNLTICDGLVPGNTSVTYGGGILAEAPLFVSGCLISNNMVVGVGGANGAGLAVGQPGGAAFGGAIHHTRALYLTECVIAANWALGGNGGDGRNGGAGGGAYGGGISSTNDANTSLATMSCFKTSVHGNTALGGRGGSARAGLAPSGSGGLGGDGRGGGFHVATGTPAFESLSAWMESSTLYDNRAIGGMGGTGRLNATSGAEGADGGTALGGGAVLNVPARLVNCTLSGNLAQGGNGGDGGFITGIRAAGGFGGTAGGGGMLRSPSYPGTMTNCTITANSALAGLGGLTTNDIRLYVGTAVGGGVWDSGGGSAQMTVMSSIIAANRSMGMILSQPGLETDWFGPCLSAGYNFVGISNAYGGFGAQGDKLGDPAAPLDPMLGPLQDNGASVPTNRPAALFTHAPLPGSPVIDAGKSSLFADERGGRRPYDDPQMPNAPGGDGSDIGAVEDGHVHIVGLRDPNQNPSVRFTSLPARRHFLEYRDSDISATWKPAGGPLLGRGIIEELSDTAAWGSPRFYRVRAEIETRTLVYATDFEGQIGSEWNLPARTAITPVGARKFLGEFGSETVALTLQNLPAHTKLAVSFDLYILKSWDGDRTDFGPDQFYFQLHDGPRLFAGTFSNYSPNQSYPGPSGASYPGRTKAIENNTLGYTHPNIGPADAVYRLSFTFAHADPSVALEFLGVNLQDTTDESWGLDNVHVEAIKSP